jgi:hypothetical protein
VRFIVAEIDPPHQMAEDGSQLSPPFLLVYVGIATAGLSGAAHNLRRGASAGIYRGTSAG